MTRQEIEMRDLGREIIEIKRHVGNLPAIWAQGGGGGSAAAFDIPTVTVFPPIPTTGSKLVARAGGIWAATAGDTRWNPLELWTALSGMPGT